ncbi:MAG: hypothetical protein HYX60_06505, partial [Legionella longbeachae]|nr:hypothetical protein [Legionella longbeachae]
MKEKQEGLDFNDLLSQLLEEHNNANDVQDLGNPKEPCSGDKSISDLIFDIDESLLLKSSELGFDFSSPSEGEPKEL